MINTGTIWNDLGEAAEVAKFDIIKIHRLDISLLSTLSFYLTRWSFHDTTDPSAVLASPHSCLQHLDSQTVTLSVTRCLQFSRNVQYSSQWCVVQPSLLYAHVLFMTLLVFSPFNGSWCAAREQVRQPLWREPEEDLWYLPATWRKKPLIPVPNATNW